MSQQSSRRNFLAAGLGAPAILSAMPQKSAPTPSGAGLNPTVKLTYRTLGKTGMKVTTMGFGCMITSDQSVVERAADMGINYFDTARGYQSGNNERMVGAALKSRRKNLYISTKSHSRSKEEAIADLNTSLRELQTDYVDVWYLHAVGSPSEIKDELIEAQAEAKKAGKIRFAGLSTHGGHKDVIPAVAANKHFDVILTTYNFAMDPEMEGLLKTATDAGLGVVAMKVMAGGQRRTGNAPARAKAVLAARRRDAGGAEVGDPQFEYPHHRTQHHRHGSAGREREGDGVSFRTERRQDPRSAPAGDRLRILPHVRNLQRDLRQGAAGSGYQSLPDVLRGLRRVCARARELPPAAG